MGEAGISITVGLGIASMPTCNCWLVDQILAAWKEQGPKTKL